MGIVDVHSNALEEIGNSVVLRVDAVDHVFVLAVDIDLSSDNDFIAVVIADRGLVFVPVVECDRNGGAGDSSLAILKMEVY